jgi:hypothetical protein
MLELLKLNNKAFYSAVVTLVVFNLIFGPVIKSSELPIQENSNNNGLSHLKFLQETTNNNSDSSITDPSNNSNQPPEINLLKLQFEFSFSCGNSYMTKKKIVNDLINEIRKAGVTKIDFDVVSHKINDKNVSDRNFNIYIAKNLDSAIEKILIATSNSLSEKFKPILESYPVKLLYNFIGDVIPDEEAVKMRKEFVSYLVNLIRGK